MNQANVLKKSEAAVDFGAIDFFPGCGICGRRGKLWREEGIPHPGLRCEEHRSAGYVPAIPSASDGDGQRRYWSVKSVPAEIMQWWESLPTFLQKT